jgi:hypothetical protein
MVIRPAGIARVVAVGQVALAVGGTLSWLTLGAHHRILFVHEEVLLVAWLAAALGFNRRFGVRIAGVLDFVYALLQWVAFENPDFRGDWTDKVGPASFALFAFALSVGVALVSWREVSETFDEERP